MHPSYFIQGGITEQKDTGQINQKYFTQNYPIAFKTRVICSLAVSLEHNTVHNNIISIPYQELSTTSMNMIFKYNYTHSKVAYLVIGI